jgi:hypothetical protein
MIFRRAYDENKKPRWGPQGAGTNPDAKTTGTQPDAKEKNSDGKSFEDFKKNTPWAADIINKFTVMQNKQAELVTKLEATADKLKLDKEQCQIFSFQPKYMSACTIASIATDITKNVSTDQVKADYQDYKNIFAEYDQSSKSILDFWPNIEAVTKAAQSAGVKLTEEALSNFGLNYTQLLANYKTNIYNRNSQTKQMDILLQPGPSGKSIIECYEEIIDLGVQGCKICGDVASSFNTKKGLGPVTVYALQLVTIYSQIASIYQRELGPTYSLIAASSNSASKSKIQNMVDLITTRIPQAYANEILKAKYALMIGKTYGFENNDAIANLKIFFSVDGGASGESKATTISAPSASSVKSK